LRAQELRAAGALKTARTDSDLSLKVYSYRCGYHRLAVAWRLNFDPKAEAETPRDRKSVVSSTIPAYIAVRPCSSCREEPYPSIYGNQAHSPEYGRRPIPA